MANLLWNPCVPEPCARTVSLLLLWILRGVSSCAFGPVDFHPVVTSLAVPQKKKKKSQQKSEYFKFQISPSSSVILFHLKSLIFFFSLHFKTLLLPYSFLWVPLGSYYTLDIYFCLHLDFSTIDLAVIRPVCEHWPFFVISVIILIQWHKWALVS